MNLDFLLGSYFDGFSFVKYGYSFYFSNKNGGYEITTNYEISLNSEKYCEEKYMNENIFNDIWHALESTVLEVGWLIKEQVLKIDLENGKSIIIWGAADRSDNLAIVKNLQSEDWFPIG